MRISIVSALRQHLCTGPRYWDAQREPDASEATDGSNVHAVATLQRNSKKGVILAHMMGRDSSDWAFLSKKLHQTQFSTIAVDLRGLLRGEVGRIART